MRLCLLFSSKPDLEPLVSTVEELSAIRLLYQQLPPQQIIPWRVYIARATNSKSIASKNYLCDLDLIKPTIRFGPKSFLFPMQTEHLTLIIFLHACMQPDPLIP